MKSTCPRQQAFIDATFKVLSLYDLANKVPINILIINDFNEALFTFVNKWCPTLIDPTELVQNRDSEDDVVSRVLEAKRSLNVK